MALGLDSLRLVQDSKSQIADSKLTWRHLSSVGGRALWSNPCRTGLAFGSSRIPDSKWGAGLDGMRLEYYNTIINSNYFARYQRFEDLPVWQEAARLYGAVLDLLEESPRGLSHGFRSQIDRASLSVSNNIAEGFERMSTAQLFSFLDTARGSAGEVRSMIAVVIRRPRLIPSVPQLNTIRSIAESCSKQIGAWMMSIERSPVKGKRHRTDPTKSRSAAA
jgi:four helix bundle protein